MHIYIQATISKSACGSVGFTHLGFLILISNWACVMVDLLAWYIYGPIGVKRLEPQKVLVDSKISAPAPIERIFSK